MSFADMLARSFSAKLFKFCKKKHFVVTLVPDVSFACLAPVFVFHKIRKAHWSNSPDLAREWTEIRSIALAPSYMRNSKKGSQKITHIHFLPYGEGMPLIFGNFGNPYKYPVPRGELEMERSLYDQFGNPEM